MRRSTRTLHGWAVAVAATGVLAACGSDSGSSPTTLQPPSGVAVTQTSLTAATVSWTAASGATGYLVQRAGSDNPGTFATLGAGAVTGTNFDDAGLSSSLSYSYRVASVSATDTSAFSSAVSFTPGLKAATLTNPIAASRTLYADTVYTLSGYVKVQNGATLTIQPGTRIIGDTTQPGSSLWILRGAKIDAQGTADAPIVLTSARSPGNRKPGDWGGLIIIGNGIINRTGASILTEGGAAGQAENYAGGNDNSDNSGTLRYVRIEFAGYDISNGAGQELNSLSSYAVGRGTTYEYIQTMSGLDDSFEYWGGAVDGRYLISYESGDDHFDWTEGYQGRNQFLIAFQSQRLTPEPGTGVFSSDPRGFEGDGCDPAVAGCTVTTTGTSTPYSMPVWANFTLIGPGQLASIPSDGNGAVFRRGTGGTLFNGVLSRWKGIALNFRDEWTDTLFEQRDSLNVANVILAQNGFNFDTVGAGFAQDTKFGPANAIQAFASNVAVDTLLGLSLNPSALDWTPKAGSPAASGGSAQVPANFVARTTGFFGGAMPQTTYLGAADPAGAKWWQGWTAYNIN
ncbi:MAG TPA: hypothetical protein VJQ46_06520 [Gemmatimonadales bacterium]|nr:hypothetical protein [Gemmatimonadales bacterium]